MEKDGPDAVTQYVYGGKPAPAEAGDIQLEYGPTDPTPMVAASYAHGPFTDQPLAQGRGGSAYYYHADHQGSVTRLTDALGFTVSDYTYDAYGRIVGGFEGIANPYTYTGRERDPETGLHHYRARAYDALTGRFLQQDPLGFAAGALNLYRYVRNDPVDFVDPFGLQCEPDPSLVYELGAGFGLGLSLTPPRRVLRLLSAGRLLLKGVVTRALGKKAVGLVSRGGTAARSAYEAAQAGGRHAGFLRNYVGRSRAEIDRSIRSLENQVAKHQAKIANPERHIPDFYKLDLRQQEALLNQKWPGDIERARQQIDVLRGLLDAM